MCNECVHGGKLKCGDCGYESEDDARSIGESNGPIATFFEECIAYPNDAVETCHQGLHPITFLSVEVVENRVDVEHVHENCCDGANDTHHFFKFSFIHTYISFVMVRIDSKIHCAQS